MNIVMGIVLSLGLGVLLVCALERIDHSLKIAEGVLRFRIIKVKPGTPEPPTPRQEAPRTRERPPETRVAARAAADAERPAEDAAEDAAEVPAEESEAPAS